MNPSCFPFPTGSAPPYSTRVTRQTRTGSLKQQPDTKFDLIHATLEALQGVRGKDKQNGLYPHRKEMGSTKAGNTIEDINMNEAQNRRQGQKRRIAYRRYRALRPSVKRSMFNRTVKMQKLEQTDGGHSVVRGLIPEAEHELDSSKRSADNESSLHKVVKMRRERERNH